MLGKCFLPWMLLENYAKKLFDSSTKLRIDPSGSVLNQSWTVPSIVNKNAMHMIASSTPIITIATLYLVM